MSYPALLPLSLLALVLPTPVQGAFGAPLAVVSGSLRLQMDNGGGYTLAIGGRQPVSGVPLSVFVGHAARTIANGGLTCANATPTTGVDKYGAYNAIELQCLACTGEAPGVGPRLPAVFTWRAYAAADPRQGMLMATLALPEGANGTAAQPNFSVKTSNPAQFAPFPAWNVEGAFNDSAVLCYGGDKSHLYSVHRHGRQGQPAGLAASQLGAAASCFSLGNGPATLLWAPEASGSAALEALVAGPASAFHLNYNTRVRRAASPTRREAPADVCAEHRGTDYVCCDLEHVDNVTSPAACCSLCKAHKGCTAWKIDAASGSGTCYLKQGPLHNPVKVAASVVVGYSTPPAPVPSGGEFVWNFGVAGDVVSVPAGFEQSTLLVHSPRGPNDAWDAWGASMRRAHNTVKRADEDVFLAALTMWTDNGAATLGPAWGAAPGTQPPAYTKLGPNVSFNNWNWSMVSEGVLSKVASSVKETGIAPRGTQLDCWWYPVTTKQHPFWCVSDWVLPREFYPNGTGGVRQSMGVPLMMYFPAACVENVWNAGGKYTWSDTAAEGNFVIPVAEQSEMFWGDVFDAAAARAGESVDEGAGPWPGVWSPPAVIAGWQGTNLAAYETDFYHNIVEATPQMRKVFGAGEMFLGGINDACQKRNMTAQLCAGNPPSFLEALTMGSITNARASIDYDWDGDPPQNGGPRSNNGAHNWAAPDNSWVFWATRIAPSKDNFWSSFRDLFADGGSQDSHRNGMDAELHAINALLLTGPVGLGDTCVGDACMANRTLIRRLARADGILLRPDRPLAPVDVMWAGLLDNASIRAMPGLCTLAEEDQGPSAACGARLWQTHATVFPEDAGRAPELATAPTRRLVSHAGVDATAQATVPASLNGSHHALQHLVRSVDLDEPFMLRASDLYPEPNAPSVVLWRSAADGGPSCVAGADAVSSGCISMAAVASLEEELFDVSSAGFGCTQPRYAGHAGSPIPAGPTCMHTHGLWQVWVVDPAADFVLLGDISKYVSLSGYRFRLTAPASPSTGSEGQTVVVVGVPGEVVAVTYLKRSSSTSRFTVFARNVTIEGDGRAEVHLD